MIPNNKLLLDVCNVSIEAGNEILNFYNNDIEVTQQFYFYKCLKNNHRKDYIILGIVAALGFLSKYLFVYLLIGVMIFYLFYIFF